MAWNQIKFFPEGLILLQEELNTGLHPKLEAILAQQEHLDWEVRIAQIASYCGVILDGDYDEESISKLGAILAGRLEVLRERPKVEIILPLH